MRYVYFISRPSKQQVVTEDDEEEEEEEGMRFSPGQPASSSWQHFLFLQPPAGPTLCTNCRLLDPLW